MPQFQSGLEDGWKYCVNEIIVIIYWKRQNKQESGNCHEIFKVISAYKIERYKKYWIRELQVGVGPILYCDTTWRTYILKMDVRFIILFSILDLHTNQGHSNYATVPWNLNLFIVCKYRIVEDHSEV